MAKRASFTSMGVVLVLITASCSDSESSGGPAAPGPRAVYVTNWASDTIASYPTNDDGSLRSPAISFPVGSGETHPQGSVRSHDGRWLYVGNRGSADVTPFRIEQDGRLTRFPSAAGPAPKPVTPSGIALNPAGNHLYTANFGNGSHYTISPDGLPHGVATIPAHGRGSTGLAISPDGRTLVTANSASGDLSAFRIAADGTLDWVTTLPTGGGAFFTAVTPDSTKVLVTNSTANTVSLLRLGEDSRLSLLGSAPSAAPEPRGIVLDENGTRAYVANFAGGTGPGYITSFAIEPATIRPSGPAVATGSNGAEGIALSGDGRTLCNANFNTHGDGSVTSYPLSEGGEIGKPRPPVPTGGRQPDLGSVTVPLP